MLPRTPALDRRKRKQCSGPKRKPPTKRTAAVRKPPAQRTAAVRKPQKKKKGVHKLPETPRESREDEERLRRESCALCPNFKRLTRKDLRHKRFGAFSLENNGLLKNMKSIFSEYSSDKKGVPVALCLNHYMSVSMHGKKSRDQFSAEFITSRNATFKSAPLYRKASQSTPLSEQRTASVTKPSYPIANILENLQGVSSSESENDASRESESPLKKLKTPQRKRPRGKSKKTKGTPELKTKHVVKAGIASNMSGSQLAKHAEALRSQKERGQHGVKVPAGATARKERSEINKVFWEDFDSIRTKYSPDNGAAQMCVDVKRFLYKTILVRDRHPNDVAVMKFNLDGGRGSQKLMIQCIFDDDPILSEDATEEEREAYSKKHGGLKDTGIRHTLILGLVKGGKESFEITRLLFDNLVQLRVLERAFPNAEIFLPNDLKQDNLACGIGPHSSRTPLHSNHWSPWAEFSDPGTVRTGKTLATDLQRRTNAEIEGKDSSAKLFHSVETEAIDIIQKRQNTPVGDTMCPCPLHLNLGVASHTVENAQKLDKPLCQDWERKVGVQRDEKRGGKRKYWCQKCELLLIDTILESGWLSVQSLSVVCLNLLLLKWKVEGCQDFLGADGMHTWSRLIN